MRILFTNNTLANYAGTELYTRDVATALKGRGHEVCAFTLEPGRVAEELSAAGIGVFNDTNAIPADWRPDLIHGQHLFETGLAALAFPDVPVISFCHGPIAWQETPCRLPNVIRWVAVDQRCKQRLVDEEGIPEERIDVVYNFVDTERFAPRVTPLPDRPKRALVFSNTMAEGTALQAARDACAKRGIELDVAGLKAGTETASPETLLPGYDLVFAKARAALEALAVGCAVVQLDWFGAGEFVCPENFDRLREVNFGYASMRDEATSEHVGGQIDRYRPDLAAEVAARIRAEASLPVAVDQLEIIYQNFADTKVEAFDPVAVGSDFLRLQALLAKKYLAGVKNARDRALQPPPPPLPAGENLRDFVGAFMAHHEDPATRLEGQRAKSQRLKVNLAEEKEKVGRLEAKVAELERRLGREQRGWLSKLFRSAR